MAPIEPDLTNSNLVPALLFAGLGTFNAALIYLVLHRVLYRAYHALTPTQATRARADRRQRHVLAFQGLAFLSFSVAAYYGFHLFSVSYQVWAIERGHPVPTSLWHEGGLFTRSKPVSLQLGRWLRETNLVAEIFELPLNRSSYQWWTQQLLLGATVWSTYAAIEGRRRNIPHLWAFVVLAVTVSVAFAQNLFFIAVLLSPVPLSETDKHGALIQSPQSPGKHGRKPSKAALNAAAKAESTLTFVPHKVQRAFEARFPQKPINWVPHPVLFSITLLGSVLNTVMIAFASNTTSFRALLWLYAAELFLPHIFLRLAPLSWGTTAATPSQAAHDAFKATGILGGTIYVLQTLIAILDNSPPPPNRFVVLRQHQTRRERLRHPGHAIQRVLGSVGDHPAISRVAYDVLVSSLSLVVWAGIRGVDVERMLRATGWVTKGELRAVGEVKDLVRQEVGQLVKQAEGDVDDGAATPRKGARPRKSSTASKKKAGEDGADEPVTPAASSARGSRSGEELHDEDWEASALGWGLLVVGGLGMGSTAVLGAELL